MGRRRKVRKVSLGFRFTPLEELQMRFVRKKARDFMECYGRGDTVPQVDIRHYVTACDTEVDIENPKPRSKRKAITIE